MALDVTDPGTWEASTLTVSTLDTPEGGIRYWVLADWDAYYEQYEDDNNLTRVLIAVSWADATTFRQYALGSASFNRSYPTFFVRQVPLRNPLLPPGQDQYLTSLRKVKVHAAVKKSAAGGESRISYNYADVSINNWPNFDTIGKSDNPGLPARIVYEALFQTKEYDVIEQAAFRGGGFENAKEQRRYVVRVESVRPRERKIPAWSVELDQPGPPVAVPEAGFVPFYDYELTFIWMRVPWEFRPVTAIENCLLKTNNEPFDWDYRRDAYGRYRKGDLLFEGLAGQMRPYLGPNGERLIDLPYVFRFQPADGTGDGMLKIPGIQTGEWKKVRVRGTAGAPKPLYQYGDFEKLFQPEPPP